MARKTKKQVDSKTEVLQRAVADVDNNTADPDHCARAELDYALYSSCDFCSDTQADVDAAERAWYVWSTADLVPEYPDSAVKWVIICGSCDNNEHLLYESYSHGGVPPSNSSFADREAATTQMWESLMAEIDAAEGLDPTLKQTSTSSTPSTANVTKLADWDKPANPATYVPMKAIPTDDPKTFARGPDGKMHVTGSRTPDSWLVAADGAVLRSRGSYNGDFGWWDVKGNFHKFTIQPSTGSYVVNGSGTKTVSPKCSKGHFTKLDHETLKLPSNYGHLRLASERDGMQIDITADFALLFSSGWKNIDLPNVKKMAFNGDRNNIPDFDADSRSNWPETAYIEWTDMKPPSMLVVKYLVWAFDQWRNGKSIQFACHGAHGRTGTFLGGLLILAGLAETGQEAVDLVRAHHCESAVETSGQKTWLSDFAECFYGEKAEFKVDDFVSRLLGGELDDDE